MRTLKSLLSIIATGSVAAGAGLSIPDQNVLFGTMIVQTEIRFTARPLFHRPLPSRLRRDDRPQTLITGLQLDILTAPGMNMTAQLGPAASNANKQLSSSDVPGGKRLLIVGFNQTPIADGAVVALTITLASGESGSYAIRLSNASGTDPSGKLIPLSTLDGKITVGGNSNPSTP